MVKHSFFIEPESPLLYSQNRDSKWPPSESKSRSPFSVKAFLHNIIDYWVKFSINYVTFKKKGMACVSDLSRINLRTPPSVISAYDEVNTQRNLPLSPRFNHFGSFRIHHSFFISSHIFSFLYPCLLFQLLLFRCSCTQSPIHFVT
jgi:hypothetical protein